MYGKQLNLLVLLILGIIILQSIFPVSAGDSNNQDNESTKSESIGTVVIATVEGDSHTYGKDSIATALEEEGFEVINLGGGISTEDFVSNVTEKNADFVFSSASMSTTMIHQIQIEEHLKATGIRDQIITGVSGSLVTQDWANKIGADIYISGPEDAASKAKTAFLKNSVPENCVSANETIS